MGVFGVAIATLIAQAVSSVLVTWALMYHTEGLKLIIKDIKIHRSSLFRILKIGFPSGIQTSMYSISNVLVQSSLNDFGVDTMAAWTAFGKIDGMIWMICEAFGIAITTFVGQNYGAGKMNRIKKGTRICLIMLIVSSVIFSALFMLNGRVLFGIFSSDKEVVNIGIRMMNIITPTYFVFAFIEIFSGTLRAEGHVLITTIIAITGICVVRILWITLIVPHGTLEQLIYCYPITWLITAFAMSIYYMVKQRKIAKVMGA